MKGGAYGASAVNSGMEKIFTFSSYRDPHVRETVEAFREGLKYIRSSLTEKDLLLALIGSVGKELRPLVPMDRGMVSFKRHLYGITDELRQKKRDIMLSMKTSDIRDEAGRLMDLWDRRSLSVLGSEKTIKLSEAALPELAESRTVLPL
jgi:Zn-dependent M16 (insulinase) family peptidase